MRRAWENCGNLREMGNLERLTIRLPLWLVTIAAVVLSLPGAAVALSVEGSIEEVVAGHVSNFNGVIDGIDPNILELPTSAPVCTGYRTMMGVRFCSSYQNVSVGSGGDQIGNISQSDNDRYFINPSQGNAAMHVELEFGLNALQSEASRIEISVEVAQAHATSPVVAYLYNYQTGRYDVVGTTIGTADSLIVTPASSVYLSSLSGTARANLLVINSDTGIFTGDARSRGGIYVDWIAAQVIPEPSAAILTSLGLLGLVLVGRPSRRR